MTRSDAMPPRRIIGNLDCEAELARHAARERAAGEAPAARDPRFDVPRRVLEAISAAATLLRAFAREDDRLWTPAPVEPERLADAPFLVRPALESGPIEELSPAGDVLAWCRTPSVEAAGAAEGPRGERAPPGPRDEASAPLRLPLSERVWSLPRPRAAAVLRVHHRTFALETAQALGVALPGSRRVESRRELEEHLRSAGASASFGERWVVKAPCSAAGRDRALGAGRRIEPPLERRIERLLALHGSLIFEPWMDRLADFGALALIGDGGIDLQGCHRQEVTRGGQFRAVTLRPAGDAPGIEPAERAVLEETLRAAAERAREIGYRGPLSIDAWRCRDAGGRTLFHPLGEVNARMTFGLVARAIAERLLASDASAAAARGFTLRLTAGDKPARAPDGRGIPLLWPGRQDGTWAKLEAER